MTTLMNKTVSALAAACALAIVPAAEAMTTSYGVLSDTVTELKLDWAWDGSAGAGEYLGTNWDAWLTPVLSGGVWQVDLKYQHLDGPHGELAEAQPNVLSLSVAPGQFVSGAGIQDHLPPTAHVGAHVWDFAVSANTDSTKGGWAGFQVQHVPEPATWLTMAAGVAALAWRRRRAS